MIINICLRTHLCTYLWYLDAIAHSYDRCIPMYGMSVVYDSLPRQHKARCQYHSKCALQQTHLIVVYKHYPRGEIVDSLYRSWEESLSHREKSSSLDRYGGGARPAIQGKF